MEQSKQRVVGLDAHPDSFAGAILAGNDAWRARVVRTSTRVALTQLEAWATRQTSEQDTLVLEASGNAFAVAGRLRSLKRQVERHGCGAMRALLVQSAKKLLQVENPLRKWGLALAARRGRNKAAVAVARKLCVAVWHVLQGHQIGALERLDTLQTKLFKFATELGLAAIQAHGYESKEAFVQQKLYLLKSYQCKEQKLGEPRFPKPLLEGETER